MYSSFDNVSSKLRSVEEEGSLNQFWISWKTPEAKQVYNGTQAVQTNLMRSLMHIKSPFIWYWSMAKEITSSNSILYFRLCEARVEIELRVSLRSCSWSGITHHLVGR